MTIPQMTMPLWYLGTNIQAGPMRMSQDALSRNHWCNQGMRQHFFSRRGLIVACAKLGDFHKRHVWLQSVLLWGHVSLGNLTQQPLGNVPLSLCDAWRVTDTVTFAVTVTELVSRMGS